jgi:ribonuclease Z
MAKKRHIGLYLLGLAVAVLISSDYVARFSPMAVAETVPDKGEVGNNFDSRVTVRDVYFPGTEVLGTEEMRVIALGTGMPAASKGQAAASFLVQLGNGENFIFDIGTHAFSNLSKLQLPWGEADKVFLSHLHFDHIGDLGALLIAGVSHGRNSPLRIWGPSGAEPDLGTRYAVEHLREAYRWEFKSKLGQVPSDGYRTIVTEFDYREVQTVYDENGVKIRSWPAIHAIDGPVSFSLEWREMKFVFSGDTYPNKWFLENATGADLLIHESFPTVGQLIDSYRMSPESAWPVGVRIHTQPAAAGKIFSILEPRMAVAYHFIGTATSRQEILGEIRTTYAGPVTLGEDLLVWNVTPEHVAVRKVVAPDIVWPSRSKRQNATLEVDKRTFPSKWLEEGRVDMSAVDAEIWGRLPPEVRERISQRLPEERWRSEQQ